MIHEFDRSGYFGASDSKYIFATSHTSKSWLEWFDVKCGLKENSFKGNIHTKAGNTWEHSILKAYNPNINFDRQIIIEDLRLRVNLDGDSIAEGMPKTVKAEGTPKYPITEIVEVKTYQYGKGFDLSTGYFHQCQLQRYAWEHSDLPELDRHILIAYGLYPDEYYSEYSEEDIEKGNLPIDMKRLSIYEIKRARTKQRQIPKILRKLAARLEREEVK